MSIAPLPLVTTIIWAMPSSIANTHSFNPDVTTRRLTLPDTAQIKAYRMTLPTRGQRTGLLKKLFAVFFIVLRAPFYEQGI